MILAPVEHNRISRNEGKWKELENNSEKLGNRITARVATMWSRYGSLNGEEHNPETFGGTGTCTKDLAQFITPPGQRNMWFNRNKWSCQVATLRSTATNRDNHSLVSVTNLPSLRIRRWKLNKTVIHILSSINCGAVWNGGCSGKRFAEAFCDRFANS